MAYYDAFIAKWATAPPGTTAEKLAWVNAQTGTGPAIPMIVATYNIYNLIDRAEFTALAADLQQGVRDIISMGTVDASPNTEVRKRMVFIFPTGKISNTNLTNFAKNYDQPTVPWWQANGYPRPFDMGDVTAAGVS